MGLVPNVFGHVETIAQRSDNERDAHTRFIERKLLKHLVLPIRFPVIHSEHNQRIIAKLAFVQSLDKQPDFAIYFLDQAVVLPHQVSPLNLGPIAHFSQNRPVDQALVHPARHLVDHCLAFVVLKIRWQWRQVLFAQYSLRDGVRDSLLFVIVFALTDIMRIYIRHLQEEGVRIFVSTQEIDRGMRNCSVVVLATTSANWTITNIKKLKRIPDIASIDMPFARMKRLVAIAVENLTQIRDIFVQMAPVKRRTQFRSVPPGHPTGSCRSTDGIGRVRSHKGNTVVHDPVDIWRLHIRIAISRYHIPCVLIRVYKNDIRPIRHFRLLSGLRFDTKWSR